MTPTPAPTEPLTITGRGPLGLVVEVLPRGAALRSLTVSDAGGERRQVVLSHADPECYGRSQGYLGVTVGRYANRLAGGRLVVDGVEHRVAANEGPNALHGGAVGWDQHDWEVVSATGSRILLRHNSSDGDQGFPGAVVAEASFEVEDDCLVIAYTATTDAPTVVSMAHHAYLNLEGEGVPGGSVDDHLLTVEADGWTPVDDDLVPTGEVLDVAGTELDWRSPTRLGDRVAAPTGELAGARGLDHNFALRPGPGPRPAARLEAPRVGIRLDVVTDAPGLQVYSGQYLDGTLTAQGGVPHGPRGGIALETQHFPDAPNQPAFPSPVLRPGQTYAVTTRLEFSHLG